MWKQCNYIFSHQSAIFVDFKCSGWVVKMRGLKMWLSTIKTTVESFHVNADISVSVGEVCSITSAMTSRAHSGLWSHRSTWRCKTGWTRLSNRFLPSETLLSLGCLKVLLSRCHMVHHKRIALCGEGSDGGEASLRIKHGSQAGLDFLRTMPFNDQLQLWPLNCGRDWKSGAARGGENRGCGH